MRARRGIGWHAGRESCLSRHEPVRDHLAPAIVVIAVAAIVVAIVATFVPPLPSIPPMVMSHVAAIAFPTAGIILSVHVVRVHPVGVLIRGPCPIPVVPSVVVSLRILIALDPHIIGAGLTRYAVRAGRRWRSDLDANADLRLRRRGRGEEECRDGEYLKQFSHGPTVVDW